VASSAGEESWHGKLQSADVITTRAYHVSRSERARQRAKRASLQSVSYPASSDDVPAWRSHPVGENGHCPPTARHQAGA